MHALLRMQVKKNESSIDMRPTIRCASHTLRTYPKFVFRRRIELWDVINVED